MLETPRLQLRDAALSDRSFFCKLLNDPSWLENIGDRGVRSEADAEAYIRDRLWGHHRLHGYGMYVMQIKPATAPIGICGLVKRESLPGPDLGFALLPEHAGRGYASEAARAVLSHARSALGLDRVYAIVKRENTRSVRLLERLGFRHEGPAPDAHGDAVALYVNTA